MSIYDKARWKDLALFKAALKEFRLRHGLEAYTHHVIGDKKPPGPESAFADIIGSGGTMTAYSFCQPYVAMFNDIKYYRRNVKYVQDRLLSDDRRDKCLTETKSAFGSFSIGWRGNGDIKYSTTERPPGKHVGDGIRISPARLSMMRGIPNVVDSNFILDLRERELVGEHMTAKIITLANKRVPYGFDTQEWRGYIAWLPDAVKESIATGDNRTRAIKTSRSRMVRFIDKRLEGVSK